MLVNRQTGSKAPNQPARRMTQREYLRLQVGSKEQRDKAMGKNRPITLARVSIQDKPDAKD